MPEENIETNETEISEDKTIAAMEVEFLKTQAGNNDVAEGETENADTTEPQESDAVKEIAKSIGWQEDFENKDKDFVSASKFITKSNEIQKTMREHIQKQKTDIETQKKQITQLNSSITQMQKYNKGIAESKTKEADGQIKTLRADRIAAIEDGDVEEVEGIEKQIAALQKGAEYLDTQTTDVVPAIEIESEAEPETSEVSPEYTKWLGDNDWYEKDPEMKKYADDIADSMPNAPFDRLLQKISRDVRDIYPDRFANTKQKQSNNVISGGRTKRAGTNAFSVRDLTPGQVHIMNQTIAKGIMTKAEYIKELQETGGIN